MDRKKYERKVIAVARWFLVSTLLHAVPVRVYVCWNGTPFQMFWRRDFNVKCKSLCTKQNGNYHFLSRGGFVLKNRSTFYFCVTLMVYNV